MKNNLQEAFTDVIYHFCSLEAALYIVKHNRFFLTSVYDTKEEKKYNAGKMYFMSFTRSFSGNIGYIGFKNGMISRTMNNDGRKTEGDIDIKSYNVRLEIDGRILSQRNKANTVNFLGKDGTKKIPDIVTNRQQEDRLISDKPYIPDARNYIRAIYIYEPRVTDYKKKSGLTKSGAFNVVSNLRGKIIYMMNKLGGDRVFVFNDWNAFNNPVISRNIDVAIEKGIAADKNALINSNVGYDFKETSIDEIVLSEGALNTIANILTVIQYGDNNVDVIQNMMVYDEENLYENYIQTIMSKVSGNLIAIKKDPKFKKMFFGKATFWMGQLKNNLSGDFKIFYPTIAEVVNHYVYDGGYEDFNDVINNKKKIPSANPVGQENQLLVASVDKIDNVISEVLKRFKKKLLEEVEEPIRLVIFDFDGTLVDTTAIDQYRDEAKSIKDKNERLKFYRQFFEQTSPYPGIVNVLNKLNSMGVFVAVVSLSPKNMIQDMLRYHNLPIQMAISIPGSKNPLNVIKGNQTGYPKSTIYRILMNKLGVSPNSVLAIGDEVTDAQQAEKAGIRFLGCNWGGRNEVNDINNPNEILNYINHGTDG